MDANNKLFITPEKYKSNLTTSTINLSPNLNDNRYIPQKDEGIYYKYKNKLSFSNDISEINENEQNDLIYKNLILNKFLSYDNNLKNNDRSNTEKKKKPFNFLKFSENYDSNDNIFDTDNKNLGDNFINKLKDFRKRCKEPYKILDIPGVKDNYTYNILDWSCKNNISICIDNEIFLYNKNKEESENNHTIQLKPNINDNFLFTKFSINGNNLISGSDKGNAIIFDIEKNNNISNYNICNSELICCSFFDNNLFSIGNKDNTIINFDKRDRKIISMFKNHSNEVININWNTNLSLLASGSKDGLINIWDIRKNNFIYSFNKHNSPTKALEWSLLNRGYLISGGSNDDNNRIIYWNSLNGCIENQTKINYPTYNLIFSKNTNEFVSTHGSPNNIIVWDYFTLEKKLIIEGHNNKIIYSRLNYNGQDLMTASADNILKFWNIFPISKTYKNKNNSLINLR